MRGLAGTGLLVCVVGAFLGCSNTAQPAGDDDNPPGDDAGVTDGGADGGTVGPVLRLPDPDHGPFRGGTTVNLSGQGFRADDEVYFGGRQVVDQHFIDTRRLEVTTPPGEPGPADVEIRRGGSTFLKREGAYNFDQIAVDPPNGSTAGGTFVTITGWGTDFDANTAVFFDGVPLSAVTVVTPTELTGVTPPGTAGDADVLIRTAAHTYTADRAYTYRIIGDPFSGGFGGPALHGTINVTVIDNYTGNGIPNAFVSLGDPNTNPHKGRTNALGQITFSGPDIVGPQRVTATADNFEVGTFDCVDSEDLSIWLRSPIPPPGDPTGSVGPNNGTIKGQVMFGDTVGIGSPFWNLVPEPRTPTERKRVYVSTTAPALTGNPIPPLQPIDYTGFDPSKLSWAFEVTARPGAVGVVAIAGLYDPARDPTGRGVQGFEPFAAGVARGVLVGPGETRTGVDVVINIPLDAAMRVRLDHPPPLGGTGQPQEVRLRGGVDLGGEGVVHFGHHGLLPDANLPLAGETVFPPGVTDSTIVDLESLTRSVADGSYALQVGAYGPFGSAPFSVRLLHGLHDTSTPVTVGDFVGVPRATDPADGGIGSRIGISFRPDGDTTGTPTFHIHMIYDQLGNPVWRGITCGTMHDVDLPDLTSIGRTYPRLQPLIWVAWSIQATSDAYREFTYRWLGIAYWRAYASNTFFVQFP
ncbi:MAG TPA: IPT/TIG domain-containing protein [Kofleriaceae bacterium]|nr:IPT/TIG domain-containing protein [Kofleriaceae bacterium]